MKKNGYTPIAEYGAIGNLRSVALIGGDGSVDWCCFPVMDQPSVFAAILDRSRGGRFLVCPSPDLLVATRRRYLNRTNILLTTFETTTGTLELTDFMPLWGDIENTGGSFAPPAIVRILTVSSGTVPIIVEWSPRLDYARQFTRIDRLTNGFGASDGTDVLTLSDLPGPFEVEETEQGQTLRTTFSLNAGMVYPIITFWGKEAELNALNDTQSLFERTRDAWLGWVNKEEATGNRAWAGPWSEAVIRSELALKLMIHDDTGAIAAAATTSLPEEIGGVRNWDYRYTWIRDASLTAQALNSLGHSREARDFLLWAERVSKDHDQTGWTPQIMYTLHGETELPERSLTHLEGYRSSAPVRIGNGAAKQKQLDVFGELLNSAYQLLRLGRPLDQDMWPFLSAMADRACEVWMEPDLGIWEVRNEPRHFVYSKVMIWVALDRALYLTRHFGFQGNVTCWEATRKKVRDSILLEGYNPSIGAFTQSFGSKELDAANLLIPILEFLPVTDPRIQGTIDRTLEQLTHSGMVYRYLAEDGLPGHEGTFNICTFWLIDVLALSGRREKALELFEGMVSRLNQLGLFSEQIDGQTGEFLGNYPQAFSHIGFINSALYLSRLEGRPIPLPDPEGSPEHRREMDHD